MIFFKLDIFLMKKYFVVLKIGFNNSLKKFIKLMCINVKNGDFGCIKSLGGFYLGVGKWRSCL